MTSAVRRSRERKMENTRAKPGLDEQCGEECAASFWNIPLIFPGSTLVSGTSLPGKTPNHGSSLTAFTGLYCLFTASVTAHRANKQDLPIVYFLSLLDRTSFLKLGAPCPGPSCTPTLRPGSGIHHSMTG